MSMDQKLLAANRRAYSLEQELKAMRILVAELKEELKEAQDKLKKRTYRRKKVSDGS